MMFPAPVRTDQMPPAMEMADPRPARTTAALLPAFTTVFQASFQFRMTGTLTPEAAYLSACLSMWSILAWFRIDLTF